MSGVRYDFSAEFKAQHEIQIAGPDDVQLTIRRAPNRYALALLSGPIRPARDSYLWSIHNGALRSLSQVWLEIPSIQSFDDGKSAFREPNHLGFRWPVLKDVQAGDQTEPAIFLMADGDQLLLGNSGDTPTLDWPNGDNSIIRRWRLSLKVTGLSEEWLSELDVQWTAGTKTLELMEYSPEARRMRNHQMNTAVPSTEQDQKPTLKRRPGRPTQISDDRKRRALSAKGGKARAQIIYDTKYPTAQQIKNVPSILRHYQRTHQESV